MNYKAHKKNNITVHDKNCLGCKAIKSDFMLSFGGIDPIDELDGNNEKMGEREHILDIFINETQAKKLLSGLLLYLEG